ncbi:ATP-dependent DNA helicase [Microbacterium invictum]|uniref:DNA 3'-5' helicase n=1 Tax=Microbacterium invictum TaxID=515415 RepID=A0AA40VLF8_9MICO|nr:MULTISPECIES: ATP-dependent DNA helicase [Microbacterium]MBB4138782.1 DNA helicase-2/ATP-dependent DNA helicase PcrA [Microbacterium invictum]
MTISPRAIAAALGQFPPTEAQARVIAAPLGPALVVAGAGSGKTETMASRVVWLVANGMVRRDQVLGLTFTRKAAGELAERIQRRLNRLAEFERRGLLAALPELHSAGRLDRFAQLERDGAGEAARRAALDDLGGRVDAAPDADALLERPHVATYNAFADAIVREHAVRVGRDAEAAVLSESAAWLLMRRVVLDSDDGRLEERGEALSSIIDGALRIARDSTDNLVDLDTLAAFPARFASVLERPSTSSRVTVYADVSKAAKTVAGLEVLVDLAREYAGQKQRQGVIDFSDQVAGALHVVQRHTAVRDELRDRYRVVLLDEYQDTSVVQTTLLGTAFRDTAVMAVGDPHQSIYGWRGASAGNLGGFAAAFSSDGRAERFALMTSWRNATRVLEAAGAVLAPLAADSPVAVDELLPRPDAPDGSVGIAFDGDVDAEADRVAAWFDDVRVHRAAEGKATTGAILFRSKKHMVRFADALGRRAIPHRILGLGGLLSTPEVVDVVATLRVISDPRAGSSLIRLLSGPRWAVGLPDLRILNELSRRIARHDAALQPLSPEVVARRRASTDDDDGSLVDALDFVLRHPLDHGWLTDFSAAGLERLRDAAGVFAGLRRAAGMPIPELVRLIELELRLDIELAANEARGPARTAGDQLRAFVDELHGFLATDESGSLMSLLAWLDHAERLDEFAPRTEPPEDDVVQLLTVHGSKGLEWDAVAVVRFVEDELPTRAKETKAWLGFGVLPYEFRGDRRWLPELRWDAAVSPTQQDVKQAFDDFAGDVRARQIDEERRLAYVAVTRARDLLLLTGSSWSGTKKPRGPSPFLREIATAIGHELPEIEPGENPYEGERRLLTWPLDPLGARREVVSRAADLVRSAQSEPPAPPSRDLELLLAERALRATGRTESLPTRIPASRFKDLSAPGGAAALARPMPERPYRQTRLGTLFHAWVEQRSGLAGGGSSLDDALWQSDDETGHLGAADAEALTGLTETFLASEWADLQPLEVESEIDFVDPDAFGDGKPRIIICKLDAVYRRADDRIEIVDWKTGRPPRTERDRAERMVQLDLYRRAYHAKHGVPLDQIDVALFYVADDLVLRG